MSTPVEKQTVIVTGASSGIGLAIARAFLDRGDNVGLNGRNEKKLNKAAEQLAKPQQTAIVVGDIADPETGRRLVETAVKRFGSASGT